MPTVWTSQYLYFKKPLRISFLNHEMGTSVLASETNGLHLPHQILWLPVIGDAASGLKGK